MAPITLEVMPNSSFPGPGITIRQALDELMKMGSTSLIFGTEGLAHPSGGAIRSPLLASHRFLLTGAELCRPAPAGAC